MDKYLIGNRLREARDEKKLTQEKLAEIVGLTPVAISNIENGTSSPKFTTIVAITKVLGISLDFLLSPELTEANKDFIYEINLKLNSMEQWELEYLNHYIDLWNYTLKKQHKNMK